LFSDRVNISQWPWYIIYDDKINVWLHVDNNITDNKSICLIT
jgi:hypothetical protein